VVWKRPIIEKRRCGNVAAGRRDQQQNGDRRTVAAIRQRRLKVILESLIAMPARAGHISFLGQEIAHAAMGMDMVRIDPQRYFEMNARLVRLAAEKQQVRQIDVPGRIVGMMAHGFAKQRAGSVFVTGGENQRAEIVQDAEVGRCTPDQFEIVALGLLE
jgi:hypothetical protein